MIVELTLVAAILVLVGLAGWRYYQSKNVTAAPPGVAPVAKAGDTTPNGKVSDAVNALDAESTAESADAAKDNANTSSVDSTTSDASNVAGSYNESQF
jgi:predicted negative regulator of RcsB-dependent stress response